MAIATQIAGDISEKGVPPETQTLSGGRAVFQDLPLGIYLGVMDTGPDGLVIDPFIVSVPAMDQEDCFDYAITLKAVYFPPGDGDDDGGDDDNTVNDPTKTPTKTPTRRPTATPTKRPTSTPTRKPTVTAKPTTTTRKATASKTTSTKPVKTGDERRLLIWTAFMAVCLGGILILLLAGRRRSFRKRE